MIIVKIPKKNVLIQIEMCVSYEVSPSRYHLLIILQYFEETAEILCMYNLKIIERTHSPQMHMHMAHTVTVLVARLVAHISPRIANGAARRAHALRRSKLIWSCTPCAMS